MGLTLDDCGFHVNYNTGIGMMALAGSGHPELYGDIVQDALDWMVFAQNNPGCEPHRGGWAYDANWCTWADNSNSGYSSLGIGYVTAPAPFGFGLTAPQFVYDDLSLWIDAVQNPDGGSAYIAGDQWSNILRTGNVLYEMALVGDLVETPRVQNAIGYIEQNWWLPPCEGWMGHTQGMFTMMKGLEAFNVTLLDLDDDGADEHDWFDEVSTELVAMQHADGAWPGDCWSGEVLSTAWALLTLERVIPPVSLEGRMTAAEASSLTG